MGCLCGLSRTRMVKGFWDTEFPAGLMSLALPVIECKLMEESSPFSMSKNKNSLHFLNVFLYPYVEQDGLPLTFDDQIASSQLHFQWLNLELYDGCSCLILVIIS